MKHNFIPFCTMCVVSLLSLSCKCRDNFQNNHVTPTPQPSHDAGPVPVKDNGARLTQEAVDRIRRIEETINAPRHPLDTSFFRETIHSQYIIGYCGKCHDSKNPKLRIIAANDERDVYTNFLTLQRYANNDGRMIDRDVPERSLLITYGLPATDTLWFHPYVESMQPMDDYQTMSKQIERWIRQLVELAPQYEQFPF